MASGTCLVFRVQSEMQLAVLRLPDTAAGLEHPLKLHAYTLLLL